MTPFTIKKHSIVHYFTQLTANNALIMKILYKLPGTFLSYINPTSD